MSRTSPGRYAIHDFAKSVYDVQIDDGAGAVLKVERANPNEWDVMPDGRLFAIQKGEGEGDITDFNVVLNWTDELRARMTTR